MRLSLCGSSPALRSPPPPPSTPPFPPVPTNFAFARTKLVGAALSLGLLLAPPPSPAVDSSANQLNPFGAPPVEDCREEEGEEYVEDVAPRAVTNESIVEEAWEIVNDSFLNTDRRRWSPETWQQKKKDISGTKITSRSKAHEIIRRMLASLGDPYTRFLSPDEF